MITACPAFTAEQARYWTPVSWCSMHCTCRRCLTEDWVACQNQPLRPKLNGVTMVIGPKPPRVRKAVTRNERP